VETKKNPPRGKRVRGSPAKTLLAKNGGTDEGKEDRLPLGGDLYDDDEEGNDIFKGRGGVKGDMEKVSSTKRGHAGEKRSYGRVVKGSETNGVQLKGGGEKKSRMGRTSRSPAIKLGSVRHQKLPKNICTQKEKLTARRCAE